jgi:hypothetical protein
MPESNWVLELPIHILKRIVDQGGQDDLEKLDLPVVLIFGTDDYEYSVCGFGTKDEAKAFMENKHDPSEGYALAWVFIEGKEVEWKERRYFDFMEKKQDG